MRFMMLCRARRLNPFEGDAHLVGYDGKYGPEFSLITAHQAFLKRAEAQPSFRGLDSGVIVSPGWPCKACDGGFRQVGDDVQRCKFCHGSGTIDEVQGDCVPPEQTLVGGWAHLERDGWSIPVHRRLSLKAYKPSYSNKFWDDNPAGQIVKCSEADVLRSTYPTLLGGLKNEQEGAFAMVVKDMNGSLPSATLPPSPRQAKALPSTERHVVERQNPDEAVEAAAGLAPVQQPQEEMKSRKVKTEPTPEPAPGEMSESQKKLSEEIATAGCTFDHFAAWAKGTGQEGNWDNIQGFADVPEALARLVLAGRRSVIPTIQKASKGELL